MNHWDALLHLMQTVDARIFRAVNSAVPLPALDTLMRLASSKTVGLWLAAGVAAGVLCWSGRRWSGAIILTVAALVLSDFSASLLKSVFHRVRPCHVLSDIRLLAGCTWSFAMPSNHAANIWAVATVAWAVRAPWRWPALLLAAAVAYSRVHLGLHYPGDVFVGALVGGGISLIVAVGRETIGGVFVRAGRVSLVGGTVPVLTIGAHGPLTSADEAP